MSSWIDPFCTRGNWRMMSSFSGGMRFRGLADCLRVEQSRGGGTVIVVIAFVQHGPTPLYLLFELRVHREIGRTIHPERLARARRGAQGRRLPRLLSRGDLLPGLRFIGAAG